MKKIEYRIVSGEKGFKDFEQKVSELLNNGWKTIGGIAFNAGYAYQAVGKTVEKTKEELKSKETEEKKALRLLGAAEGMKLIDDMT
jgi:hypothetical protein